MVNFNTFKSLNITLANTNKALGEVLKSITPKELESISQGKDLKSIISTLLQQSTTDSSGDKKLLSLLKNSSTFKELGSVQSSIKELLQTLSKEKSPLQSKKQLTNFLDSIKNINEKGLQSKIENSGVFLENKIKNLQSPQIILKNTLEELSVLLQETKLPNVKALNIQLKELLGNELFKNISNSELLTNRKTDTNVLAQMSKNVQTLLERLGERLNSTVDKTLNPNDVLFSKESKNVLEKLHLLNKPELLVTQNSTKEFFSKDLKAVLLQVHEEIQSSSSPNKAELLKQIDKLTLQIDYHQLLSQLSNASSLYIPYSWDMLKDGNITMKSTKEKKFFTDINLTLKEYGALKIRLGLFEKNQLNINITAESKTLKNILKENIAMLKKQLLDVGVTPTSIRFLDENEALSSAYTQNSNSLNAGFEAKV